MNSLKKVARTNGWQMHTKFTLYTREAFGVSALFTHGRE